MTDNEKNSATAMSDNEIIKALEEFINRNENTNYVAVSMDFLKYILDLINRQKEDLVKKDKELLEALKRSAVNKTKVIDCEKEINRQKAEIENLSVEVNKMLTEREALIAGQETLQKALAEKNAEISEYQNYINRRLDDVVNELLTTYDVERAKSEAIKEFAERLKGENVLYGGDVSEISENIIDDLLKEMTAPSLLDKKIGGDAE